MLVWKNKFWTSLVVQWLRMCLPMQGTQVPSLVQEDSTCHKATKPMHHNYRAHALESTQVSNTRPTCSSYWSPCAEAANIKKRWQEYTEELYKKDHHDPDNHNGVIAHIHLEPDILECEVKWALGSITMNKASGGDGIPVELFQILKDDAVKCCTQCVSKFGKLSSGRRTGKDQFSFQSQRKTMPKNAQTTAQLHSSYTLVK